MPSIFIAFFRLHSVIIHLALSFGNGIFLLSYLSHWIDGVKTNLAKEDKVTNANDISTRNEEKLSKKAQEAAIKRSAGYTAKTWERAGRAVGRYVRGNTGEIC